MVMFHNCVTVSRPFPLREWYRETGSVSCERRLKVTGVRLSDLTPVTARPKSLEDEQGY